MKEKMVRIAVSGGAGQIAYNLLFRIASGELFGPQTAVSLQILEVPAAVKALEGVAMELEDCAFPLLKEIVVGSDPRQIFLDADYAILVGAKPRGPGMERAELLTENGKIFIEQGRALNDVANRNVKVLVVGNPCNTNALIAMNNAPDLNRSHFFAMTRLDENRAAAKLAEKIGVNVSAIKKMVIWGNHSLTQVPDEVHAECNGKGVMEVVADSSWFHNVWIPGVQKRGSEIIAARGKSSAASAANAIIDTIRSICTPTEEDDCYSLALCSDGNSYGIEENLIFSFPCRSDAEGNVSIVEGLKWGSDLEGRIRRSEKELIEEREMALSVKMT